MGINVAGCADVAMAQVVETDVLHLVRYEDPDTLAWMYVSPIIVLLSVCDRQPEREAESLAKLDAHVKLFFRTFNMEQGKK